MAAGLKTHITGRTLGLFTDEYRNPLPALVTARALHHAGYNVLLFDLRNHGESDGDLPLTFGVKEGRDFAGAVDGGLFGEYVHDHLRGRDGRRGWLGCVGLAGGALVLPALAVQAGSEFG